MQNIMLNMLNLTPHRQRFDGDEDLWVATDAVDGVRPNEDGTTELLMRSGPDWIQVAETMPFVLALLNGESEPSVDRFATPARVDP